MAHPGNYGGNSEQLSEEGEFLEKLKEYLLNRYKKEEYEKEYGKCWYGIIRELYYKSCKGTELKWKISGTGMYPQVSGDVEGNIFVSSPSIAAVDEAISLSLEVNGISYTLEELEMLEKTIPDRRNWGSLEKKYKILIKNLRRGDEVAKTIAARMGIEVVFYIPYPEEGNRLEFIAYFNSRDMSIEEKIKAVEKALNALEMAIECLRSS